MNLHEERRRNEAQERQAAYDKLTTVQKLAKLDETFGEGVGASRQRAKLNKLLAKARPEVTLFEGPGEPGEAPKPAKKKRRDS